VSYSPSVFAAFLTRTHQDHAPWPTSRLTMHFPLGSKLEPSFSRSSAIFPMTSPPTFSGKSFPAPCHGFPVPHFFPPSESRGTATVAIASHPAPLICSRVCRDLFHSLDSQNIFSPPPIHLVPPPRYNFFRGLAFSSFLLGNSPWFPLSLSTLFYSFSAFHCWRKNFNYPFQCITIRRVFSSHYCHLRPWAFFATIFSLNSCECFLFDRINYFCQPFFCHTRVLACGSD